VHPALLAWTASATLPENITFGVLAAAIALSALRVVTTKNVVHAALYLVVVLAGVAANYLLLGAEFVAVSQILVYIGAIVVLFLFGIMLTQAQIGSIGKLDNDQRWVAAVVALFLAGTLATVLQEAFTSQKIVFGPIQRTSDVSLSIFQTYVIPFEVVSIVLLAALVGAIVIARRD
jgi:NADH-quinone oxidoreductase subunit J